MNITDHAIVRYLERIQGLDVEAIRNYLATDNVRAALALTEHSGSRSTVFHPDGFRLIIQGGSVVTCVPDRKPGQDNRALAKRAKRHERKHQEQD